ncbi:MAG TPA: hypothetical protein VF865_16430 [Acidobacteriaceae bacterium]
MRHLLRGVALTVLLGTAGTRMARAIEVKISALALERTLRAQLFNGPDGRYYMRGGPTTPCFVYAESPHVTFKDDRVLVHVHTRAKLGTGLHGACIGVSLTTEADVSLIPDAEGESVGFRDARIERLSESKELNFLLEPFLSHKLPSQMKMNAADLMRELLSQSVAATGYTLTLTSLKLHSMLVDHNALVVDVDAAMSVE